MLINVRFSKYLLLPLLAVACSACNAYPTRPNDNTYYPPPSSQAPDYQDDYQQDQYLLRCSSNGHQRQYCAADTRYGVNLNRQLSRSRCRQGDSWGYDYRGIWVSQGCRGEFSVNQSFHKHRGGYRDYPEDQRNRYPREEYRGGYRDYPADRPAYNRPEHRFPDAEDRRPPPVFRQERRVECASFENAQQYCRIPIQGSVRLEKQVSASPCRPGESWGYDSQGIWVNNGCRAVFLVE